MKKAKLIVALDVETFEKARDLVERLAPVVEIFKVGPVLFTAYGPQVVDLVHAQKRSVFLDLKFHDIPNTVALSVRQAVRLGVMMMTLHASGGNQMINAAAEAARDEAQKCGVAKPLIVGVTVLTSQEASFETVLTLAQQGIDAGLDGVVASVRETSALRKAIKKDFVIVTPGIRPAGAQADDQKRVATVFDAVKAGSSFLVVGRPIIEAADPVAVARGMVQALETAV
ncbi:MAG TPA: orotidine-5'-phosphate decarboxylase [Candidatus Omnitrophota bacterium]|nr:orotidine-5'-phosphate decarboxylase [Candidatus Omnitrophota bacterium]HPT06988.1 orotidine-5'-phosphate decarboxylase [Candidatus Omnitrophota bacterium]